MKTNVRWIFSIIFLFVSLNCNAQLTGIWQDDNGTRYSIRQIGNEIFWRMDGLPHVINVFSGTIAGNTITGEWADLPGGNKLGTGTIALKLETRDRMVRISKNDNYGASQWVRIPVFVEPAGPTTQNTQTQTTQTQSNQTTSQRTANEKELIYNIPGFSSPLPDPPPLKPTILADNGNNQDYYADSGEPLIRIKSIEIKWRDENEDPKYMCSSSPAVIITVINRSNKKYVSNQSVTLLGNMSATTEKKTKEYILKARMNNVSIDYDNCTWEFIEEEIRFVMENHSIPSLEPYEETTFSASINPLIPKFDIGAELIEWDYTQNQNNPKERVSDGLFKEFKRSGPDISYDKGQTRVIFKEGFDNGKVVGTGKLKVQVTNMGDKATTGEITVELNFKQKKSEENEIAPKWVIKIPALQAGETRGNFNEEGVECVIIGDPNWDECWIHVSWTCPLGIGGMDIDYRNNFIHKTTSKQRF